MSVKKNRIQNILGFFVALIIVVIVTYIFIWYHRKDDNNESAKIIEKIREDESEQNVSEPFSINGLSFKYPSEYKVIKNESVEGNSLVTFEKAPEVGFQLFGLPFDEEGPITPERIQRDIPGIVINDSAEVEVGGVKILTFYSYEEGLGETFEAWFVHDGKLYQLSAYKGMDGFIRKIINTMNYE